MDYGKILKYIRVGLIIITVIILSIFIFGGNVPDQLYTTPVYTSLMLNWSYILVFITVGCAIVFPIIRMFTRTKEAMKSFFGLGVLAFVFFLAYLFADGTPLNIMGYSGPDNVPATLIFTDTMIYAMYFLFIGALGAIAVTSIIKRTR